SLTRRLYALHLSPTCRYQPAFPTRRSSDLGFGWIATGAVLGLLAAILVPVETPDAAWFVFLCGMAAIAAMLVPGISGSFVLLIRSEEHTSELQSRENLVCRLLLEKKIHMDN